MTNPSKADHVLEVPLQADQFAVLTQEARRMSAQYGQHITPAEVLVALVELHKRRLRQVGHTDGRTLSWLYGRGYSDDRALGPQSHSGRDDTPSLRLTPLADNTRGGGGH